MGDGFRKVIMGGEGKVNLAVGAGLILLSSLAAAAWAARRRRLRARGARCGHAGGWAAPGPRPPPAPNAPRTAPNAPSPRAAPSAGSARPAPARPPRPRPGTGLLLG